jgi:ribosomal protein L40E
VDLCSLRCTMKTRPARRLPEGQICFRCDAKHPLSRRRCSSCARMRLPVAVAVDGLIAVVDALLDPLGRCATVAAFPADRAVLWRRRKQWRG